MLMEKKWNNISNSTHKRPSSSNYTIILFLIKLTMWIYALNRLSVDYLPFFLIRTMHSGVESRCGPRVRRWQRSTICIHYYIFMCIYVWVCVLMIIIINKMSSTSVKTHLRSLIKLLEKIRWAARQLTTYYWFRSIDRRKLYKICKWSSSQYKHVLRNRPTVVSIKHFKRYRDI